MSSYEIRKSRFSRALAYKLICSGHSGTESKRYRRKIIIKKSNILIAVIAVMSAASSAKAEGPQINFDGGTGARSFMEAIKSAQGNASANIPEPAKPEALTIQSRRDDSCHGPNAELKLNSLINYSIDYSEKNKLTLIQGNMENLLANGSIEEKCDFVQGNQKRYTFPSRIAPDFKADKKDARFGTDLERISKSTPVCISWAFKEVCVNKTVWNDVCNLVAGACVVITAANGVPYNSCAPAYMLCRAVATIIPECASVPTHCLEMGEMPGEGNPGVI